MSNLRLSGGMLVFLGALFWSLNSPLVKFISLDSIFVCGLRSAIAAVALCAFVRPKQLKWNGWMLVYVCSYASLCLSIIIALKMTSAPVAIGMQYTSIIWLFLVATLRARKVNVKALVPVCVIVVGVVCALLVALLIAALYLLRIRQKKGGWVPWFLPESLPLGCPSQTGRGLCFGLQVV